MWCRTILTAVAISCMFTSEIIVPVHGQGSQRLDKIKDVICVLLLNGLQKEDLDANTLEKLRRHNVNIDDMNNESLRQACLLNSYSDTGNGTSNKYETTEVPNEALGMSSTPKSEDNETIKVGDYLKLELRVPESYENKTIPNTIDFNKTANFLRQLQTLNENLKTNTKINTIYNSDNVTKIEENSGLQIEYMQNRPPLENVVNFWTKLTHNTKTVVTKVATPPCTDRNEVKNVTTVGTQTTDNNGYVHSREVEYISRIIAEYLVTQTAPTTTQKVTTEPYINTISRQIGELLKNTPKKEQTTNEDSRQAKDLKRLVAYPRKLNYDFMTDDVKSMPYKILFENNLQLENIRKKLRQRKFYAPERNGVIKSIQPLIGVSENSHQKDTPYTDILKVTTKSVDPEIKSAPTRFLDDLLREKNNINSFLKYYNESIHIREGENDSVSYNQRKNITSTKSNTKTSNNNQDSDSSSNQVKDETKELVPNNEEITNKRIEFLSAQKEIDQKQNIGLKNNPLSEPPVTEYMEGKNEDPKIASLSLNETADMRKGSVTFNEYQQKVTPADIKTPRPNPDFYEKNYFDPVLPSIKVRKQNKKPKPAELVQNFVDHNQFKNLAIDPKTAQKYEFDTDQFGGMLPSIKMAKMNQQAKNKSNQLKHPTELNDSELVKKFSLFNEQYKAMQAEASKSGHNEITNLNNNNPAKTPLVTTNDKQTLNLGVEQNQFNIIPAVIKNTDRIQLSRNQLKISPANLSISQQNQKLEINNEQLQPIPVDIKDLKQFQNFGMNMNEPQVIPPNVLKEIAEKVKQIVLRDMKKSSITTTAAPLSQTTVHAKVTTPSTTNLPKTTKITTTTTTTTTTSKTTTEKPITPREEPKGANQVMQKLMEMFNEFKMIKDSTKMTTLSPLKTTTRYTPKNRLKLPLHTFPPILAGFNPYIINTPPIFKSGSAKPMELSPYGPNMVPIPISAGANLPKNKLPQYVPILNKPKNDFGSGAITIQTNSDEIAPLAIQVSKPMKLMNQHIIVTTRNPTEKRKIQQERASIKRFDEKFRDPRYHKEKYQLDSEFLNKIRLETDRHEYYNDRLNKNAEKPNYSHEFNENLRGLSHAEIVARPIYRENGNNQNKQGHGYPREFTYTGGLSNLGGMSYLGAHHSRGFKREQVALNDKMPHGQDQDRLEPQYSAPKFHEKLERIENWPRNTWFMTETTDNCCGDMIAPRKQVSLTKMKQRTRFDDTHFKNFLKSQQKVTDMLERILASNTKSNGPHSVELP